jgi:hypothetical protein
VTAAHAISRCLGSILELNWLQVQTAGEGFQVFGKLILRLMLNAYLAALPF